MAEQVPTLGFIGLGNMGKPMANRLRAAGYQLTVWNRTEARARQFAEQGGGVAASPSELAARSSIVVLSVSDDAAVDDVLLGPDGVLAGAQPGAVIVNMSTVAPETAQRHAREAAARGVAHLDAPVSGSTRAAEDGALVIMVGGEQARFEALRDLFSQLSKAAYHLGESGSGAMMKLVVNTMLGGLMEVMSESLALGQKAGLAPALMVDIIANTSSGAPLVKARGPGMVENRFPAAFPLRLMSKDFSLIMSAARRLGVPMPAIAIAAEMSEARNNRGQEEDFSAVFGLIKELAGLR
ncbi:MAG: NAD(P)-dependent oxidoreductase [Chloroflexi bacterium]|nr:NAD(P)-dependent oxidoreductase [Chloroflexota bacterium]